MPDTLTAPCNLDTHWLGYWGQKPSGIACGEPSSATVRLACVHEHIDTERVCWQCATDVQQASGYLTCPRCWNSVRQHTCYTLVAVEWDSGDTTELQGSHCGPRVACRCRSCIPVETSDA